MNTAPNMFKFLMKLMKKLLKIRFPKCLHLYAVSKLVHDFSY